MKHDPFDGAARKRRIDAKDKADREMAFELRTHMEQTDSKDDIFAEATLECWQKILVEGGFDCWQIFYVHHAVGQTPVRYVVEGRRRQLHFVSPHLVNTAESTR